MTAFDDPIVTVSYGVQWRTYRMDRWKVAGRTWSSFDKALNYAHQHSLTYPDDEVRMFKTETMVETVWMAAPRKPVQRGT